MVQRLERQFDAHRVGEDMDGAPGGMPVHLGHDPGQGTPRLHGALLRGPGQAARVPPKGDGKALARVAGAEPQLARPAGRAPRHVLRMQRHDVEMGAVLENAGAVLVAVDHHDHRPLVLVACNGLRDAALAAMQMCLFPSCIDPDDRHGISHTICCVALWPMHMTRA